jgi:hypothetical protein
MLLNAGDTYFLIGNDTTDNGTAMEFDNYFEDKYHYNIGETQAEFLKRSIN